jgi:hypothetical protein
LLVHAIVLIPMLIMVPILIASVKGSSWHRKVGKLFVQLAIVAFITGIVVSFDKLRLYGNYINIELAAQFSASAMDVMYAQFCSSTMLLRLFLLYRKKFGKYFLAISSFIAFMQFSGMVTCIYWFAHQTTDPWNRLNIAFVFAMFGFVFDLVVNAIQLIDVRYIKDARVAKRFHGLQGMYFLNLTLTIWLRFIFFYLFGDYSLTSIVLILSGTLIIPLWYAISYRSWYVPFFPKSSQRLSE